MKAIYEIITVRKANKDLKENPKGIAYILNGKIWMYGAQKNLAYPERWRAICNTNMWEEKLEEDMALGLKVISLEEVK